MKSPCIYCREPLAEDVRFCVKCKHYQESSWRAPFRAIATRTLGAVIGAVALAIISWGVTDKYTKDAARRQALVSFLDSQATAAQTAFALRGDFSASLMDVRKIAYTRPRSSRWWWERVASVARVDQSIGDLSWLAQSVPLSHAANEAVAALKLCYWKSCPDSECLNIGDNSSIREGLRHIGQPRRENANTPDDGTATESPPHGVPQNLVQCTNDLQRRWTGTLCEVMGTVVDLRAEAWEQSGDPHITKLATRLREQFAAMSCSSE